MLYINLKLAINEKSKSRLLKSQKHKPTHKLLQWKKPLYNPSLRAAKLLIQVHRSWIQLRDMKEMYRATCSWNICNYKSRCSWLPRDNDDPFWECICYTDCSGGIYLALSLNIFDTFSLLHTASFRLVVLLFTFIPHFLLKESDLGYLFKLEIMVLFSISNTCNQNEQLVLGPQYPPIFLSWLNLFK